MGAPARSPSRGGRAARCMNLPWKTNERNGVFAFAVREGLRGRAAMDADGRVSALALGEFVMRRVPQLAAEKHHRQDAVFRTAQRDLHSFPLGLGER